jgi:2-amino-4-hydroxy-6-hydroxymethyldihydropteridine diphosphokinase
MPRVALSIGSNVDRRRNIRAALDALARDYQPIRRSPVYESAAVGFEGPPFFNLVICFETGESVDALAIRLREIEASLGRERTSNKYDSRNIDIDLLLYGDSEIATGRLKLPRDEIGIYPFVLKPLSDLLPNDIHPVTGKTYLAMWREMESRKDCPVMRAVDSEMGALKTRARGTS